ncbi:hypothetical protein THAOC_05146 [Thalassiosira oceanica]|uniref:Uncharacterized protein n=1 Tax=Thalassiosira oceanica TaxID=159749 RepID=K0T827_THAOC|nr:hypothetical protein THAOC_05146 [Thalassiosira oceanica]|eukprot:EJK73239.1 hypothetical protein THAOC_05146 [Thalassiosira oceanica]
MNVASSVSIESTKNDGVLSLASSPPAGTRLRTISVPTGHPPRDDPAATSFKGDVPGGVRNHRPRRSSPPRTRPNPTEFDLLESLGRAREDEVKARVVGDMGGGASGGLREELQEPRPS